jgi:hypothetical protein
LLNGKKIKVVINGGAHNPKGLAEKVQELVSDVEEFVIAIEGIQESCEGLLYMI